MRIFAPIFLFWGVRTRTTRETSSRVEPPPADHPDDGHRLSGLRSNEGMSISVASGLLLGVLLGLRHALATLPTTATRLSYIAVFGLGSVLGMASLSGLVGLPLRRWRASQGVPVWLSTVTGSVSLVLGCAWGWSAITGLLNS